MGILDLTKEVDQDIAPDQEENVTDREKSGNKQLNIVITRKCHQNTIDEIGTIQQLLIKKEGGTAQFPTSIAIRAIHYYRLGLEKGVELE
jgi:hypothetical protein